MTRPRSKTSSGGSTRRVRLIALLAMTLSATGCATDTPAIIPTTDRGAFCERYFDADNPPIWIDDSDSQAEADAKIDLLIVWKKECGIDG